MSNLIAIETATDMCSVALLQDSHVTAEVNLSRPRAHSENLLFIIKDVLQYVAISPEDLDVVAVSMGPGSYTGLRIGVSTAKGLAMAVDARLVSVPTLEALAMSIAPVAQPADIICALLHARRNEVYFAAFQVQRNKSILQVLDTTVLEVDQLPERLGSYSDEKIWLVGNGGSRAATEFDKTSGQRYCLLNEHQYAPSAAWIARLAQKRVVAGQFEDVSTFEPYYLKEFIAKKPQSSMFEKLPF